MAWRDLRDQLRKAQTLKGFCDCIKPSGRESAARDFVPHLRRALAQIKSLGESHLEARHYARPSAEMKHAFHCWCGQRKRSFHHRVR